MNRILIFASLLAVGFARPDGLLEGNAGYVSVTQSTLGTYKFTVHLQDGLRSEERLADGTIFGQYPVPDESGISKIIRYTSGKDGFKILEEPLPEAPVLEDVGESVVIAKEENIITEVPLAPVLPVTPKVVPKGVSELVVIKETELLLPEIKDSGKFI